MSKAREASDYSNKQTTKNAFFNANFDVWQRGTTLGSGTGPRFLADRWRTNGVGTTNSMSRESFTVGQTDVPDNPRYYNRIVVNSVAASPNFTHFTQPIEGVDTFAGETVTLSFYAKSLAPLNIATEFTQIMGTGGSPSPDVTTIQVDTHALTPTWQRFEVTTTLPSLLGKTLGTNGDDRVNILFWLDAGSDFDARTNALGQQSGTIDFAHIQLEKGGVSSDFETRSFIEEVLLCQRYYAKSFDIDISPTTGAGILSGGSQISTFNDNSQVTDFVKFPVLQRATPTITTYNPVSANNLWRDVNNVTDAGVSIPSIGTGGFRITGTAGVIHGGHAIHWTAEAEL